MRFVVKLWLLSSFLAPFSSFIHSANHVPGYAGLISWNELYFYWTATGLIWSVPTAALCLFAQIRLKAGGKFSPYGINVTVILISILGLFLTSLTIVEELRPRVVLSHTISIIVVGTLLTLIDNKKKASPRQ